MNQLDSHVWLGINYFNCKNSEETEIIPLECFVSAMKDKTLVIIWSSYHHNQVAKRQQQGELMVKEAFAEKAGN